VTQLLKQIILRNLVSPLLLMKIHGAVAGNVRAKQKKCDFENA
jgi:hypothetical protein